MTRDCGKPSSSGMIWNKVYSSFNDPDENLTLANGCLQILSVQSKKANLERRIGETFSKYLKRT